MIRPFDARLSILDIFYLVLYSEDPLSPSKDGIQLGALDGFLYKRTFFIFDPWQTPLET